MTTEGKVFLSLLFANYKTDAEFVAAHENALEVLGIRPDAPAGMNFYLQECERLHYDTLSAPCDPECIQRVPIKKNSWVKRAYGKVTRKKEPTTPIHSSKCKKVAAKRALNTYKAKNERLQVAIFYYLKALSDAKYKETE